MTRFLKKIALLLGGVAVALSGALAGSPAWATEQVDVELVLAVDVSGSMNYRELDIQRRGYVEAFRSRDVISAIEAGLIGSIAVTYVEWARDDLQRTVVPWTKITNEADANAFAALLEAAPRRNMQYTSISGAISTGVAMLDTNSFDGMRQVIDISGDGPNNQGTLAPDARDAAIARGVIINGLPLMTEDWKFTKGASSVSLDAYYQACVIGGPGSFLVPVHSWGGFSDAVRRKIMLEIAALPQEVDVTGLPVVPVQFLNPMQPVVDCMIGEKLIGWGTSSSPTWK
ncbi:MAG: DUF1194 domain-containing protein [Pseudomonadota bacterium]